MQYDFKTIESKWQDFWERADSFKAKEKSSRPKYYCLMMFPYPSGTLHVGHGRNYIIGDAIARYKIMQGLNVLTPMGWDAFGLPAENAAIREGIHPSQYTLRNIERMKEQFRKWGVIYDWSREIAACHPGYYRWTQWLFLQLHKKGLAYRALGPVNYCPSCQTVLANEQVIEGACERCESPVEPREMEQWYFKITQYADRLVDDLDELEEWPERIRTMQEEWIGRSKGARIVFELEGYEESLPVFTTRPDTVFGVTFMALAPEHPLVAKLASESADKDKILAFVAKAQAIDKRDRGSAGIEKEGMFLGAYAINPVNAERVPIWVTNYVVMDYGTGAVMGVPAHDQRDLEFSRKHRLPVRVVIQPKGQTLDPNVMREAHEGEGVQVNSGQFDGLPNVFATKKIIEFLEENEIGEATTNYRLRDWLISRQRYWGAPIPIVYCERCGTVPVPEEKLPVLLPDHVDYKPTGGHSPLHNIPDFLNTSCPQCGGKGRRETDTLDTFVDSSWYFLRYLCPRDEKRAFDSDLANRWMPVDQYVGGAEHATKHLIYARFITKVLYDFMLVEFEEPFQRLFAQGMITKESVWCATCRKYLFEGDYAEKKCVKCGREPEIRLEKMSKSRGNVVDPGILGEKYGADTQRVYTLFVGPPEKDAVWDDQGVMGAHRFLWRVWQMVVDHKDQIKGAAEKPSAPAKLPPPLKDLWRKCHETVKKVTEDMEGDFKFNTAISAIMELVNEYKKVTDFPAAGPEGLAVLRHTLETTVILLSPFAPHLSEELWEMLGKPAGILKIAWPKHDPKALVVDEIELVIQVDGKVRGRMKVAANISAEDARNKALVDPKVQEILGGQTPKDIMYITGRLVNVVTDAKEKKKAEAAAQQAAEAGITGSGDWVSIGEERDPGQIPGAPQGT